MPNRTGRPGKTIDYKQWFAIPFLRQESGTDGTLSGGAIGFLVPATILRMRGYVQVSLDATKQVDDRVLVTFGLAIMSTDAFLLGPTSFPDPADEPEFPWLWWAQMQLEAYVTAGEEAWGMTAQRLEVDSKAMRKVKPGQSLVWVAQKSDTAGAVVSNLVFGETRVLIGT